MGTPTFIDEPQPKASSETMALNQHVPANHQATVPKRTASPWQGASASLQRCPETHTQSDTTSFNISLFFLSSDLTRALEKPRDVTERTRTDKRQC